MFHKEFTNFKIKQYINYNKYKDKWHVYKVDNTFCMQYYKKKKKKFKISSMALRYFKLPKNARLTSKLKTYFLNFNR